MDVAPWSDPQGKARQGTQVIHLFTSTYLYFYHRFPRFRYGVIFKGMPDNIPRKRPSMSIAPPLAQITNHNHEQRISYHDLHINHLRRIREASALASKRGACMRRPLQWYWPSLTSIKIGAPQIIIMPQQTSVWGLQDENLAWPA